MSEPAGGYEIWYRTEGGGWKLLAAFPASEPLRADHAYEVLCAAGSGRFRLVLKRGTQTVTLADSAEQEQE